MDLKQILEQYRNGERGLPTYNELAAIADESSAKRAINAAIDELAREPGAVGFMHSLPPHHTRYVAGGSLGQIVSMARRRKDEGLASIAGGDHDGHARINGAPAATVAEPKAGQHCVRCGGTFGGWCDCSDNRAVRAQQQAEPGADEPSTWALIEQYADAVADFNVATYRGIDSKPSGDESLRIQKELQARLAAQSGQRARGTPEQILTERKLTCEAIEGAIAFGYQNTNPPPSDDHWLAPFWKIGRKQSELEQSGQRAGVAEYLQQIARAIEEDHPEQAYNLRLFIAGAAPTQQGGDQ